MTFGCCYLQNLPDGTTPGAWLDRVLPRPRETFEYHLDLGYKVIASNSLDVGACLFAEDDRGPVGLVLLTGSGEHRQLALVAVRGDRRQRGLGKTLLERSIGQLRDQAIHTLTASRISSANAGAVRLLESFDFVAKPKGGIRMRRLFDTPLPDYADPEGFDIRPIRPGEEADWVCLKNACFHVEGRRSWTVDDFNRAFANCDHSRILIAIKDGHMAGTASAWEANYGGGPVGLIHWVGTDPEFRGKGLGYALSLRALEELAALGYEDAWLNTSRSREPAVRLYKRLGFRVHRETVDYTLVL